MLFAGCLVGGMVVWGFMVVIVSVVGVTGWFAGVLGLCVWFAVLIWWFIVVLDGCCCCSISLVAWFFNSVGHCIYCGLCMHNLLLIVLYCLLGLACLFCFAVVFLLRGCC